MEKNSKIYIAGHRGLVGSAIVRELGRQGYNNLIVKTSKELDLRDGVAVKRFFKLENPDYVFLAAAKVGGIMANSTKKAEFIYDNLMIQSNVIHNSYLSGVKKLLFLGSSCIYPRLAPQPIKEEYLLSGYLEETNDAYAIAKIAGMKMCEAYREQYNCDFISCMPTNLYGCNDNFDLETSHVLPALVRKFYEAKENGSSAVVLWGTGNVYREFLYVDDMADACIFLMKNYSDRQFINIGTGKDISIRGLADLIKGIIGYSGDVLWDSSKPDGTPKKMLNVSRLKALGWEPRFSLKEGISISYDWYKENKV
jgi:GDP-L-fucose synthase